MQLVYTTPHSVPGGIYSSIRIFILFVFIVIFLVAMRNKVFKKKCFTMRSVVG